MPSAGGGRCGWNSSAHHISPTRGGSIGSAWICIEDFEAAKKPSASPSSPSTPTRPASPLFDCPNFQLAAAVDVDSIAQLISEYSYRDGLNWSRRFSAWLRRERLGSWPSAAYTSTRRTTSRHLPTLLPPLLSTASGTNSLLLRLVEGVPNKSTVGVRSLLLATAGALSVGHCDVYAAGRVFYCSLIKDPRPSSRVFFSSSRRIFSYLPLCPPSFLTHPPILLHVPAQKQSAVYQSCALQT